MGMWRKGQFEWCFWKLNQQSLVIGWIWEVRLKEEAGMATFLVCVVDGGANGWKRERGRRRVWRWGASTDHPRGVTVWEAEYMNLELSDYSKLEDRLGSHQHRDEWSGAIHSLNKCLNAYCTMSTAPGTGDSAGKDNRNLSPQTLCILVGVAKITQGGDGEWEKIRA